MRQRCVDQTSSISLLHRIMFVFLKRFFHLNTLSKLEKCHELNAETFEIVRYEMRDRDRQTDKQIDSERE